MNKSVAQDFLRKLSENQNLKRKLKIFLGFGLIGFLLVGGLIIWAGVATVQHVVNIGANSNVTEQVRNLKAEIPKIPALAKVGCWDQVTSLMNVKVWLEKPVADNSKSLRDACLEKKPAN